MPHHPPIQLTDNRQNYRSSTMPAFICLFVLIISLVGYTSISEAASHSQVEAKMSTQDNISVTTPAH